jgi:hypothetical protein
MQVFELHFNPKTDKERSFDTFIYEPENTYEKGLGGLYMIGELSASLFRSPAFLFELSSAIKDSYYSSGLKGNQESNLKKSLKSGNDFLKDQTKKGNVDWLGNLNFMVINYNDSLLNFAKTGDIKIILVRKGEFMDIGSNLEDQPDQTDSNAFGKIASGKIEVGDKILAMTSQAFSAISKNSGFLLGLAKSKNEKSLKEVIKNNKEALSKISGVCLVMTASESSSLKREMTFKNELPEFSFKESLLRPIVAIRPGQLKLPFFKIPQLPKPRLLLLKPKLSLPKFKVFSKKKKVKREPIGLPHFRLPDWKSKEFLLVFFTILLMLIFFSAFRGEKTQEVVFSRDIIDQATQKVLMAENLVIIRKKEEANNLFQESLALIRPLLEAESSLKDEARNLEQRINNQLEFLSQD